jgi:hypothetical protein
MTLLALAACTDHNPAGSPEVPQPALPPSAISMVTCTVSVRAGTLACGGASVAPGVSATIIGGQGTYVRLASSGVSYDSSASTLRLDVTVENLTGQALGTADGVTPSPDGVRVFFQSGPTVTAGDGEVAVANADGQAAFMGAAQKYFQYDGILPPGDTTPAKEWRFSMPAGVSAFTFGVYVASPVRAEGGWVSVSPLAPSVVLGDSIRLSGVVRNAAGGAVGGAALTWTSSDTSVVTVDAQGLAKGVGLGMATVTASGGGRTGSVQMGVYANDVYIFSTLTDFAILAPSVAADGNDQVTFEMRLKSLVYATPAVVYASNGAFGRASCTAGYDGEGSHLDGRHACSVTIPHGAPGGTWRVDSLVMYGPAGRRPVTYAALLAAGAPAHLYVDSPGEDRTAPTLDSLALSSAVITAGGAPLEVALAVTDSGVGIAEVRASFTSGGNPARGCLMTMPDGGTIAQPVFRCQLAIPDSFFAGTLLLQSVFVRDHNGNQVTLRTAALDSAGFQTKVIIASDREDAAAPTITAFSFSPGTLPGNGVDSVTVTLSATEPPVESGVRFLDMEFERVDDTTQTRRCLLNGGSTRVFTRTMTCRQAFAPGDAGEWRVRYIRAIDLLNNAQVLYTADIQAAGYPTQLTITPP